MSKELEALKEIMRTTPLAWSEIEDGFLPSKEYELIKSALERKEKLEKVWEIIKKYSIEYCASMVNMKNYQHYLESFLCSGGIIATETEFNLLKEML